MKRIIILLFLISYIFCSIESCTGEKDSDKCSNHDIEYKGFSCYAFNSDGRKYCSFHPDSSESQKVIFRLMTGILKELESGSENDEDKNIDDLENFYSEKESYNKGEVIVLKTEKISEEDKKIIMGKKTCRYLFDGRFNNIVNDETLMQNYKGHPDIEDKNTCFNAEQFPDLKDLLDCGYAEIKYTTESNKQYTLKTCYFIPNDKMPEEFGSYLTEFINNDFEGVIPYMFYSIEYYETHSQYSENRRLDANNCEIIVEDKNGKKVKYTPGSTDIEVIGNGNDQNNNNNSDNNNNNDNNKNNNDMLGLNIILLLSLILLNF